MRTKDEANDQAYRSPHHATHLDYMFVSEASVDAAIECARLSSVDGPCWPPGIAPTGTGIMDDVPNDCVEASSNSSRLEAVGGPTCMLARVEIARASVRINGHVP